MEVEPARYRPPPPIRRPAPRLTPAFEWRAGFRRREHLPFHARKEALDEDAGRSEAGQLYDRRGSELDERAERQSLKGQAGSGDVLAELSRSDLEANNLKDKLQAIL
ncbi:hypothetical protein [Bradyrhizobium sp. CCBAU 51627]|uniref:hypothetical protein n=1 Tax=Bradyrhizobium sp. CCBAU 51627 TaxID=1325088 RepID=UPI002305D370|nr:hypothetical protein [Bradyrhizobium sp. CCBAU 51627]